MCFLSSPSDLRKSLGILAAWTEIQLHQTDSSGGGLGRQGRRGLLKIKAGRTGPGLPSCKCGPWTELGGERQAPGAVGGVRPAWLLSSWTGAGQLQLPLHGVTVFWGLAGAFRGSAVGLVPSPGSATGRWVTGQ